jgi:hypothetical protein
MSEVQTEIRENDLRGRAAPREVRFGAMGKIFGAVAVLVLVGAVGSYVYETRPQPKPAVNQHVSMNQLPPLPANPPAQPQTQQ